MNEDLTLSEKAKLLSQQAEMLAQKAAALEAQTAQAGVADPFVYIFTIFVLACFVGYYVVWKVTPALHTPLMAATNAISAISLVASLVIVGAERPFYINVMGAVAVAAATINVVGGFVITDRMLKMFKKTEAPK